MTRAVAAAAPDVAAQVGRLAADRMTGPRGLQAIAAEPGPPRAISLAGARTPSAPDSGTFSSATRSAAG